MNESIKLSEVLTKVPTSKHISFTSSQDVKTLFERCYNQNKHIKSFCFTRYFNDGSRAILDSNCIQLEATYYSNPHCVTYYHPKYLDTFNRIFMSHLIENLPNNVRRGYEDFLTQARESFGVHDLFYVLKRSQHFIDSFVFSTAGSSAEIVTYLVNNIEHIEGFCNTFYHNATSLIESACVQPLVLPWCNDNGLLAAQYNNSIILQPNLRLSNQEVKISKLLIIGNTAKEIGKICNLSYRTVQHYIANIKKKHSVTKTSELIYLLAKTGL